MWFFCVLLVFSFFFNFFFFSKEKKSSDESDEIFENENRKKRKKFCFFLKFFSLSFSLCLLWLSNNNLSSLTPKHTSNKYSLIKAKEEGRVYYNNGKKRGI